MAEAVAVNFPALPAFESRSTVAGPTTGRDTTATSLSDEQRGALDASDKAIEAEVPVIQREAAGAQAGATAEQEQIDRQQAINDWEMQQQTSPEMVKIQQYISTAKQHTKDEEAKLAGMPSPALFADLKGWDKTKRALGLMGAGLGAGMVAAAHLRLGLSAPQDHSVDDIIERDLERQRAAIGRQSDAVVRARTGIKDAEDARQMLMASVSLRGQQMYKRAELVQRSRLAQLKYDQAAIDADRKIVELKGRQAEKKVEYVKGHSNVVQSKWDSAKVSTETINRTPPAGDTGAGKVPGQASALAKQALTELAKLEGGELPGGAALNKVQDNALTSAAADTSIEGAKPLSGTVALGGRALGMIPRNKYEGLSEKDRVAFQTMDRAQQLLMHVMTGAGASVDEARKKAEAFGWVPGDTAASMKSKLTGAKELAYQFAGPAAAPASATPGPAPAQPARTRSIGASAPPPPASDPRLRDPKAIARAEKVVADRKADEDMKNAARAFLRESRKLRREAPRGK